ncbi:MAG: hypothetical protein HC906_01455 [Bacteroidales bacterium]|nr:hypothetical protein [Bacteroidales bacterium]
MANTYTTICLRSKFTAYNSETIKNITIQANYDDGFIIWINGIKALERLAPANLLTDTLATENHESGNNEAFVISTEDLNLVDGENSIAVQGFNVNLPSTDFYLDLQMKAEAEVPEVKDTIGLTFSHASGFYSTNFSFNHNFS